MWMFTRGSQRGRSTNLVFGENAGERFSAWLSKFCVLHSAEMSSFGVLVKDIGTHSFRKGVASELSNTLGGLEAVNVWLRAGWTLGSVQGRYIFADSSGDTFVGRATAGHNVTDVEFSCLPPHFKDVGLSNEQWEAALPGGFALSLHLAATQFGQTPSAVFGPHLDVWVTTKIEHNVEMGRMHNSTTNLQSSGFPPHVAIKIHLAT
ncbi:hypothetical protein AaE_003254, partial [Aphanomyces astaci]